VPFDFKDGTSLTSLTTTGLSGGPTLTIKKLSDGSETILSGNPINTAKNVKQDNYDFTITGTRTSANSVGIDYSVAGHLDNVNAGQTYTLSFRLTNVNSGPLTVEVFDAGVSKVRHTFSIRNAQSNEQPPSGDTGAPPAARPHAAHELLAPPGISPTTVTIETNPQGVLEADYTLTTDPASGIDATVSIDQGTTAVMGPGQPGAGQPISEISVTPLDPVSVAQATAAGTMETGVFSFSGLAVECGPTGAVFSGDGATVSFTLTDAQWAEALAAVNGNTAGMTVQTFDPATQTWVSLATTVDPATHTVSTQVNHFSLYALFYKTAAETPTPAATPQTYGELMKTTPASTPVTSAPVTTPVKTMLAPPSPTPGPGIFDSFLNWISQLFGRK
jgi:hypothetical protein